MAAKATKETEPAKPSPLDSAAGRAWLTNELARAEYAEAHGPGGTGWAYNEARRAEIVERAEFLRALVAAIN